MTPRAGSDEADRDDRRRKRQHDGADHYCGDQRVAMSRRRIDDGRGISRFMHPITRSVRRSLQAARPWTRHLALAARESVRAVTQV